MPMIWLGTRDSSIPIPISPAPQVRNSGKRAPVLVASWAVIPIRSANSGGGTNSLSWRMLNGPSAGAVWATNRSSTATPRRSIHSESASGDRFVHLRTIRSGRLVVRSFHVM